MAERRRSWTWRDRSESAGAADGADEMVVPETEMIVGLSLGQNHRLGTQAGEVWASAADVALTPSPASDPGAVHVQAQGRQSTLLTIGRLANEVEEARASERKANAAVAQARLELRDAVGEEHRAQRAVDDQAARAETVNLSLIEDAPAWIFVALIAVIVVGEWVLNRVPLEIAGDNRFETNLLAAALAVGLVAGAHLGGVGIKRALVRANGAARPAAHHLVMAGVLVALVLAAVAMSGVRVAYFDSPLHDTPIDPPWLWLLLLQVFLLTVATLLSMAHDSPMRLELSRRQDLLEDAQQRVAAAMRDLRRAADGHLQACAKLRAVGQTALTEIEVQHLHTRRGMAEFNAGFQSTLGRPVVYEEPDCDLLPAVGEWRAWLEEAAEIDTEVDALVRSWQAELDVDQVTARETSEWVGPMVATDAVRAAHSALASTNGSGSRDTSQPRSADT